MQTGIFKKDDSGVRAARAEAHVSRPLSELKDPASFPPPPRYIAQSGGAAAAAAAAAPSPAGPQPAHRGYAAPAPQPDQTAVEDRPPPTPYRVDTTGLSTAHFPPPPSRRDGSDGRTPPSHGSPVPPSLPPRLPPRAAAPA